MKMTGSDPLGRPGPTGARRPTRTLAVASMGILLNLACGTDALSDTAPASVISDWPVEEETSFETWLATGASRARDDSEAYIAIGLTPFEDVEIELGLTHGRIRDAGDEGEDDGEDGEDGEDDGGAGEGETGDLVGESGAVTDGEDDAAAAGGDDATRGETTNRHHREIELALAWTAYTFDGDDRLDEGPEIVLFVEGGTDEESGGGEASERERSVRAGGALEWPLSDRLAMGFALYRERVSDADGARTDTGAVFGVEVALGARVDLSLAVERLYDGQPATESTFELGFEVHERLQLSIGHRSMLGEPDEVALELVWRIF